MCNPGFTGDGHECQAPSTVAPANPCLVPGVCAKGAVCHNQGGQARCLCRGQLVNHRQTCCNREYRTFCWGDPHCTSWDGSTWDFMGRCIYTAVTTHCHGRTLVIIMILIIQQRQGHLAISVASNMILLWILYLNHLKLVLKDISNYFFLLYHYFFHDFMLWSNAFCIQIH